MSLSQKIAAALEARPDNGALPCDVSADDGPSRLSLHVTASGPVGLAFDTLDFASSSRDRWTAEDLRAWGERIESVPIDRYVRIVEGRGIVG